ncbi:MAG TPA: TMEM165/GDT1 family protein [Woeseiaceae bacterium]
MDWKVFVAVFGTVFLAELGDKTQLATVLFASKPGAGLLTVFVAASLALMLSSAIAVGAGAVISEYIDPRMLSWIAGAGFIVIGIWTIWQAGA